VKFFTRIGSVIELFLVLVGPVAAAQRYCADPATGDRVEAGALIESGKKAQRCCQRAPVSGRASDAFFIDESKFKHMLEPHRCWSTGLRTRDFTAAKIPTHRHRQRRFLR
jgi:hypothetical protein